MDIVKDRLGEWEARCKLFLQGQAPGDIAHDKEHLRRVVLWTKRLLLVEGGQPEVAVIAAWLHDCVSVPKDSPERKRASILAAERAAAFLGSAGYPEQLIPGVFHAIAAHSFSAGIPAETLEAKIVQDADRLEALGAIGLSRCLMLGGAMGRPLYDLEEPFPEQRPVSDRQYTIDHFYAKLLTLAEQMHTTAARQEAKVRTDFLRHYLNQLGREIGHAPPGQELL